MESLGATLVDPANVPNIRENLKDRQMEIDLCSVEFADGLEGYLGELEESVVRNMVDVVK